MSNVKQYRKKPVVIEASYFDGSDDSAREIEKWSDMKAEWHFNNVAPDLSLHENYLVIPTLEGNMRGSAGDYIIKGVNGEFYPCKLDIFEKTYDAVDPLNTK